MDKLLKLFFLSLMLISMVSQAIEVVSDNPDERCREVVFRKPTKIFKDPGTFLSIHNAASSDLKQAMEMLEQEDAHLTTVRGRAMLRRLGPPRYFKPEDYGVISVLFEKADPGLSREKHRAGNGAESEEELAKIVPVIFCGDENSPNSAYQDSLAFVIEEDLNEQTQDSNGGFKGLPPSTQFIPDYLGSRPDPKN